MKQKIFTKNISFFNFLAKNKDNIKILSVKTYKEKIVLNYI